MQYNRFNVNICGDLKFKKLSSVRNKKFTNTIFSCTDL